MLKTAVERLRRRVTGGYDSSNDLSQILREVKEEGWSEDRFVKIAEHSDDDVFIKTLDTMLTTGEQDMILKTFRYRQIGSYYAALHRKHPKKIYIDKSIELIRVACSGCPEDSVPRQDTLGLLSRSLMMRYHDHQELADLEETHRCLEEALKIKGEVVQTQALLNDHAATQRAFYLRTKSDKHLKLAVKLAREASILPSRDAATARATLANLSQHLASLFAETEEVEIMKEAISTQKKAMQIALPDGARGGTDYYNLARLISAQWAKSQSSDELNAAIDHARKAVEHFSPERDRDKAAYYLQLAELLRIRYTIDHGLGADLEEVTSLLRKAVNDETSSTQTRVLATRHLMLVQAGLDNYTDAGDTATEMTKMLPQLAPQSTTHDDTQHRLSESTGLSCDAVAIMLTDKRDIVEVINVLEAGRGILANSIAEVRADTPKLHEKFPQLFPELAANSEEQLQKGLDSVSEDSSTAESSNRPRKFDVSQYRLDRQKAFGDHLKKIREQCGFETFLHSLTMADIQKAAKHGPVVYINYSFYRSDAIIITSSNIDILRLPQLQSLEMQDLFEQDSFNLAALLEKIWDEIAAPILDQLGFHDMPSSDDWPHVWWILGGPLSRFPIHAAGYHRQRNGNTVIDRCISSYASSIKALIRSRTIIDSVRQKPDKALLVAVKSTPGQLEDLPYAVDEVQELQKTLNDAKIEAFLPLQTKQNIVAHLPHCQIFHFAGHSYTSPTNPLASALLFRTNVQDRLTVDEILKLDFQKQTPFLAFLSACGTGRLKARALADESMHLVSACLIAGFRHVVGTLWEVKDKACIELMRSIYSIIIQEDWTDNAVAKAVHHASREMRNRWILELQSGHDDPAKTRDAVLDEIDDADEEDFVEPEKNAVHTESWVPYVHFGP